MTLKNMAARENRSSATVCEMSSHSSPGTVSSWGGTKTRLGKVTAVKSSFFPFPFFSGIKFCSELKELLEESDFVVLCLPHTAQTQNIISSKELSYMKSTAILVNVGRGATVNHDDLTAALQNGIIKGAALDVTEPATLPRDHPLLNMSNVIITPHIATYSGSAHKKMYFTTLEHLRAGIKGEELLYSVN